jgi:phage tail-like protein
MSSPPVTAPRLLALLPAIYREDAFLGTYLAAFEEILLQLESRIDGIAALFDPMTAPEEFLDWLSSWVAFTLRSDIGLEQRRRFLAGIVPLYRRRGTKANLEELLSIFTHGRPTVSETTTQLQIGVTSRVGIDTFLGAGAAHFFHVKVVLPQTDDSRAGLRDRAIARALIDLEKPAHTAYELEFDFPTLQIGVTSHVGVDTLLGVAPAP